MEKISFGDLEIGINNLERNLRTSFNNIPINNTYIVVNKIDNDIKLLNSRLNTILNGGLLNTGNRFIANGLEIRLRDLAYKYEEVKRNGVNLNGDILYLYGQIGSKLK